MIAGYVEPTPDCETKVTLYCYVGLACFRTRRVYASSDTDSNSTIECDANTVIDGADIVPAREGPSLVLDGEGLQMVVRITRNLVSVGWSGAILPVRQVMFYNSPFTHCRDAAVRMESRVCLELLLAFCVESAFVVVGLINV